MVPTYNDFYLIKANQLFKYSMQQVIFIIQTHKTDVVLYDNKDFNQKQSEKYFLVCLVMHAVNVGSICG